MQELNQKGEWRARHGSRASLAETRFANVEEKTEMTNRFMMTSAAVGLLLALGACSNSNEMDAMKSQIASAQATANAADQKATQALAEAQAASAAADLAAADAAEASRKADEIFRAGLRK
ncbi:MAG: hypothetical protein H6852_11105 [Geminicoccaceae bacterium]|nr:hypothetical protein [Geminicoccaceae bacterium]HRY23110.1 hypothetical protein [Geminicoccaceae bacterium]